MPGVLKLPDNITPELFLEEHWQKRPLNMPAALDRLRPAISRNELAWLATLEDVESRIVFIDRSDGKSFYRAETGPFDVDYLRQLPKRDWTLLVHDVEKHIPAMRALFDSFPFVPEWRIDDLMVSFAAPGGGVGPHRDNYDVFLCQGTGIRNWCVARDDIVDDPTASDDLALLSEFTGEAFECREGDVLYLPPGIAHWGTARRACLTYSIGMRAPLAADIALLLDRPTPAGSAFYADPDLALDEAAPAYISRAAAIRATRLLGLPDKETDRAAIALGLFATQNKEWLRPDGSTDEEKDFMLSDWTKGTHLVAHGMARIAFDDRHLYLNGQVISLPRGASIVIVTLVTEGSLKYQPSFSPDIIELVAWMLMKGAFQLAETS